MPSHRRQPGGDRRAQTAAGVAQRVGSGRDDRAVVGHDENAPDLERCFDDVAEHRHRRGGPDVRRKTPLRVAAVRNDDRRHAPKSTQAAFVDVPVAPGPEVAHSSRSNQCVPLSASATWGSVWPRLKTWCSRSQQISTWSSETCEMRESASAGSCASRDRVVLELEVRVELHELRPVGAGARGHGVALLLLERPAPCKAHDSALAAAGVHDEDERVVELVVEALAALVGESEAEVETPVRERERAHLEADVTLAVAGAPSELAQGDRFPGDECAGVVAQLELEARWRRAVVRGDRHLQGERLAGEELEPLGALLPDDRGGRDRDLARPPLA